MACSIVLLFCFWFLFVCFVFAFANVIKNLDQIFCLTQTFSFAMLGFDLFFVPAQRRTDTRARSLKSQLSCLDTYSQCSTRGYRLYTFLAGKELTNTSIDKKVSQINYLQRKSYLCQVLLINNSQYFTEFTNMNSVLVIGLVSCRISYALV